MKITSNTESSQAAVSWTTISHDSYHTNSVHHPYPATSEQISRHPSKPPLYTTDSYSRLSSDLRIRSRNTIAVHIDTNISPNYRNIPRSCVGYSGIHIRPRIVGAVDFREVRILGIPCGLLPTRGFGTCDV